MDQDRIDHVIQLAVLVAGREDAPFDRELGPIHLIKYVYLADLAYAERHGGETYTGVPWQFYHYGPWSPEVNQRIEPALYAISATEKTFTSPKYESDFKRWSKVDDELLEEIERLLPPDVVSAVKRHVHKFGKDTAELLHFVYVTPPMLRAAPREQLVFEPKAPEEHPSLEPSAPPLSKKQQKRADARFQEAKARVAQKMAERRAAQAERKLAPPPRYDEVFFEGVAWLDELAGEPIPPASGEISIDHEIWNSPSRTERRG
jgi:hypothetical protein